MLKIRIIAIIITIILLLSACQKHTDNTKHHTSEQVITTIISENNLSDTTNSKNDNSSSDTTTVTESKTTTADVKNLPDYKSIKCREVSNSEWQSIRIKFEKADIYLQFNIPNDWNVLRISEDTLNIKYKNKKIGTITTKSLDEPIDYFESQGISEPQNNISVDWQINWNIENNNDVLYKYFKISCDPLDSLKTVNLLINYAELDKKAAKTLANSAFAFYRYNETNTSNKILILGNSFISTSQIGSFLSDMINQAGKNYIVEALSYGNASATTFINNSSIIDSIYCGEYRYVFQCGFYNDYDVNSFKTIKHACTISNTYAVIFPAHNEVLAVINSVKTSFPNDILINWKDEIDRLINLGVDYYDFCIDDGPQHSTALAGYVGAYAIYRNMFDEHPPTLSNASPLSSQYISKKLGNNYFSIGNIGENLKKIRLQTEAYQIYYKLS